VRRKGIVRSYIEMKEDNVNIDIWGLIVNIYGDFFNVNWKVMRGIRL
jgi:hypothetical protein